MADDTVLRLQALANYGGSAPPLPPMNRHRSHPPMDRRRSEHDRPPPSMPVHPPSRPSKKRKIQEFKRWNDPQAVRALIPGVPLLLPNTLSPVELDALLLRARIEELTYQLKNEDFDKIPQRSPSPPPIYDGNGKRTNTREQRIRQRMERERHLLIEKARKINPMFKPPSDYRPVSIKITKKIKIPVDKYPDYNFIGLILGPRGSTQKEMERNTGTKISIRGKGAVKNESKRRYNNPDDNEDLHVLITGDTEKQVKEAGILIEDLLVPVDDDKNEHKWKQLELLAEWNGTKTGNWRGRRRQFNNAENNVYCTFCGEVSHPTSDCPFKNQPGAKSKFEDEYKKLMSELAVISGDAPMPLADPQQPPPLKTEPGTAPATDESTEKSYEELMAYVNSLENSGNGNPPPPAAASIPPWQRQNQPRPPVPPLVKSEPGTSVAPPWARNAVADTKPAPPTSTYAPYPAYPPPGGYQPPQY